MKLIKRLLKILVALVLLVVIAAVALVFVFDPNMFKPRLEAMAQEQGIQLDIDGNLGWQLWPALGVEVNGIRVAAESAPDEEIARLERASLRVAVMPLLRGELSVHHILVDGAALDLRVDEQGEGNWEQLLTESEEAPADDPAPTTEPEDASGDGVVSEEGQSLQLAVEQLTISNASLRYRDAATGQDLELSPLNLSLSEFNLQGRPFAIDLGWEAQVTDEAMLGDQPLTLIGQLSSRILLAEDMSRLELNGGQLDLELARAGASDDIRLTLDVQAEQLLDSPTFNGSINLRPFNPKALMAVLSLPEPEMAKASALTRVAAQVTFAGTTEQIELNPVVLELDDTRIEGRVAVTDFSRSALEVALRGDSLNIDDYLPPPSEEEEAPTEDEATGDKELIPLELVRELHADIGLQFGSLTVMDLAMTDLDVQLRARDGLVELQKARINAYEGELDARGELDGRGETAVIDFVGALEGLELAPLLRDLELDENLQLSGALNANVDAATRGVTMNQLMDSLRAETGFSGAQVRLAPLNIEQKFCQVVNLVTRAEKDPAKTWADYTEMKELSGKALMEGRVFTLESLQAGVERLTVGARGELDLAEAVYDFTLPLRLGSEASSEGGCRISSNYWMNRSLSLLRCRGSLDSLNPVSDCRPDKDALESLVKDFAEYQVREQHGERIDEEKARAREKADEEKARLEEKAEEEKEQLRDKVREKLGGEEGDDREERLKDLFRR
ncbi:AsmA family protein [Marinimicrobium sp. C2-29]|uniref:AsmA family protein n=1 Tax=Marinimicrobium sp. C2-29 TaxID=3139825 RepID=UPI0031392158